MKELEENQEREDRIVMEVIVDAYGPEEQAMGWYYYLEEKISFPFTARCKEERRISPLKQNERVNVTGMAGENDCLREMFVEIEWQGRTLGIPLAQLEPLGADDATCEAIADWHYWVGRGYQLG